MPTTSILSFSFSPMDNPIQPLWTFPLSLISEETFLTISIGTASAIPEEGASAWLKTKPEPTCSLSRNSNTTGLSSV